MRREKRPKRSVNAMNGWENCDVFLYYETCFISSSFLLLLLFHVSQLLHQRRRCADGDPFALRSKWVLRVVRNLAPAIASGKYFGSFQLEKKKRSIPDLVVIRIVRPHGQLQGVFAIHHSFFFFTRYVTRLVLLRPRLVAILEYPEGVLPLYS